MCLHIHVLGGDQLTATRARGCQRIRSNSTRGKDRLEGLVPVVEDWHAKVSILGVRLKILYNSILLLEHSTYCCVCTCMYSHNRGSDF